MATNIKVTNDQVGLTWSAVLLVIFIIIHPVGNLHVGRWASSEDPGCILEHDAESVSNHDQRTEPSMPGIEAREDEEQLFLMPGLQDHDPAVTESLAKRMLMPENKHWSFELLHVCDSIYQDTQEVVPFTMIDWIEEGSFKAWILKGSGHSAHRFVLAFRGSITDVSRLDVVFGDWLANVYMKLVDLNLSSTKPHSAQVLQRAVYFNRHGYIYVRLY